MADFFTKDVSLTYDKKNSTLSPISENMHFLIRLILKELPVNARILCVGIGTGQEIMSLSKENPHWTFVGVDPSAAMLEVCAERLKQVNGMERCQLIHGYVEDVSANEPFDAVVSILVGHFVKHEEKRNFYQNMQQRLKTGGLLVNTEISVDLDSQKFPLMLENWKQVQSLMGATPSSLEKLPETLKNALSILPPSEIEALLHASGFEMPIHFFQAFMINGWYGKKNP